MTLLCSRTGGHPYWHIVIDSRLRLSCTAETFVVEIDLRAQHNGTLVFERRWREEVLRVLG
jgi:hypothetical protein